MHPCLYELERSTGIKIPLHKQFTRIRLPNIWSTAISFNKCVSDRGNDSYGMNDDEWCLKSICVSERLEGQKKMFRFFAIV